MSDTPRHAFADAGGPLCGDPTAAHISTGPPDCPGCIACQVAAAAATGELSVLVVIDISDDDRQPGEIVRTLERTLKAAGELVVYAEDLPTGVRILAPGERNGRA